MRLYRFLIVLLLATLSLSHSPQAVFAQSGGNILKVARGAVSRDIKVNIHRAIVIESAERFAELSVANPDIADVAVFSDNTIYILGKATGATTLTLVGEDGRLITNVTIRVTPDLSEFKQRLREILPKESIDVREANGGIALSGVVSGAQKIDTAMALAARYAGDNVANLMSVGGTQQVQLKVRFAEMQRSAAKQLGLNFSSQSGNINNIGNVVTETGQFLQGNNANIANGGVAFADATNPFGLLRFSRDIAGTVFDVVLSAAESKGVVRTLAEPNLVALSGETAEFLAGGELPIPVAGEEGNVTVSFRPFGVAMNFTPTVVDEDLINLELDTEVSAIDAAVQVNINGVALSGFTTRRARTTVELRDGESIAIAGLLQEDFSDAKDQFPWLGDLPVLGALFRSSNFQRNQSELVIIITPRLVAPVDGDQLSLPTDRMRIPNETELFLFGQTEGTATLNPGVISQGLDGNYGYILE
ncbi:MAG: type II and III secretion system protein family protein [Pikeienuella sp.]